MDSCPVVSHGLPVFGSLQRSPFVSFSQVLMDQQNQSRWVTFDPTLLQPKTPPMVLLLETGTPLLTELQVSDGAVDQ